MIYDKKENLTQYKGISSNLDRAIEYLLRGNFSGIGEGKYPVHGDVVFALVQTPKTKTRANSQWESHEQFIDIQFLLFGSEQIGFQNSNELTVSNGYDFQKDITFYHDNNKGCSVKLVPESFVILFPADAHMPLVCTDEPQLIKKVIVKVKI